MFKNRELRLKMEKVDKDKVSQAPCAPQEFERKTEVILRELSSLGAKMFLGVCVYVLLDTHRQVQIEKAKHYS